MSAAKYPANFYDDDWGRIHKGHGLSRYELFQDLNRAFPQPPNTYMRVDELNLREIPRVMWCERYDTACEFNGEWHRHWAHVTPASDDNRMSLARWAERTEVKQ